MLQADYRRRRLKTGSIMNRGMSISRQGFPCASNGEGLKSTAALLGGLAGEIVCRMQRRRISPPVPRAETLYALTQSLARARGMEDIFEAIERCCAELFGTAVALVVPEADGALSTYASPGFRFEEQDRAAAAAVIGGDAPPRGVPEPPD